MSFKPWLEKCDKLVEQDIGVGLHDLDDWLWMAAYEDESTPEDAVEQFKEDIGYNF